MGSLCCVAARPHGSHAGSRQWSIGPNEPYWQTNTSFSPPLSRRWDYRFQSEGLSFGSRGAPPLYGSSASSNSKESRSSAREEQFPCHQYAVSDGGASYFSSPANSFQAQQCMPPPVQDVHSKSSSGPSGFLLTGEETSMIPYSDGSTSSRSDTSECESISKMHIPSHRNFSGRYSFMSKPIHPLYTPEMGSQGSLASTILDNRPMPAELLSEPRSFQTQSSSSSMDLTDISECFNPESSGLSYSQLEASKCGLCERFLSQRSPWSSRRIVRSGDMPVTGVLSCHHVYHAECLEQSTPKIQKHDPPCPICTRSEGDNFRDQRTVLRLKSGFPRLQPFGEEGPSRSWSCGQVGDCVEGALHGKTRNSSLLLNRNPLKKQHSLKGNSVKEGSDKLKNSGPYSLQLINGRVSADRVAGCSRTASGSILKRR